ncbi:nipblb [Symbiodinium sp. KB8]|nr:nipblb [Symbiodinium sp. KB8]
MRWIGARTDCSWRHTAEEQLRRLRSVGLGAEPTWLAVLHRIQHRDEAGYHRWCSGYLKHLRRLFGRELNSHLHSRPLQGEEVQWAAQVEHAAYQDFLHYVKGRRDEVNSIPYLSSDDVILATQPMHQGPPAFPYGMFHANWVDNSTGEWGCYEDLDPSTLVATGSSGDVEAGSRVVEAEGGQHPGVLDQTEMDVASLFQLHTAVEARWHRLIDQLHDVEEGLAAGLAVRMARHVAMQVADAGFLQFQWARGPLHTLGAGIVFSDGASQETTPPRMYTWASEVVACLLQCYRTESDQASLPEPVEDEVSLMDRDRDRRYRDGRRRYRDSRSPRRSTRPTCSTGTHGRPTSSRAERLAARGAHSSGSGRNSLGGDSEYVEVHLEEAVITEAGNRGPVSTASGSGGPARPTGTELVESTGEGELPRGAPSGDGRHRSGTSLPIPRQPMTMTQAVDQWRYLLFSRTAMGPELEEGSRLPNHWLPESLVREICRVHEGMSTVNRGISTIALLSVVRFLTQELCQTLQQADTIARTRDVGRRHGQPDEDDEELLLQVGWELHPPADFGDEVHLMQGFFHTDGRDSMQQRIGWIGMGGAITGAAPGSGGRYSCSGVSGGDGMQSWVGELSTFIPGIQMWSAPIHVDSQPRSTSSGQGDQGEAALMDREIEDLLRDEDEERELRRREAEQDEQREADRDRLCQVEVEHLKQEAVAYKAWEDRQILQYLEDLTPADEVKKRCVLQVELASGSGDRPRKRQMLTMEVPEDGTDAVVTIKARLEPDPDGVETQMVPTPRVEHMLEDEAVKPENPEASLRGDCSQQGQCSTVPELLPHLDFSEYGALYDQWLAGRLSTQQVAERYGKDTADMIEAQFVVSREVDAEEGVGTQLDVETEGFKGDD